MVAARTGAEVARALADLAETAGTLAERPPLDRTLAALARAVAAATGAEAVVVWLPVPDGVAARGVSCVSAGLAAELEGLRVASLEQAATAVCERVEAEVEQVAIPLEGNGGGALMFCAPGGLAREEIGVAVLAAELVSLAARLEGGGRSVAGEGAAGLEVAGDALAAVAGDEGTDARVARLAAVAAGADGALVWRVRGDDLQLEGAYGELPEGDEAAAAARAIVGGSETLAVEGDAVSVQLGQPALGALQLRFAPGREPDDGTLARLGSFAVRAAHALRASERARDARLELERSRALLAVVGEAISRLSLSHTLDTAVERVGELLGADRVAIYLREDERTVVAACRGLDGPHAVVAEALLAAALTARAGGTVVEVEAAGADERLAQVRAELAEAGISAAVAVALVVGSEPIGLLAVYPRQRRPVSANERALLAALGAQLAVAVENARLHEQATALGRRLEHALESQLEQSKRLQALYEVSRSFAQSLSLDRTLEVLAKSIVDLLQVDAAVIRMPDERGLDHVARAVHVNDERVDPAARALLGRPQQLPGRELTRLLERNEPLVLDAERAEALGGALALLAPFLRKGSSAALVPVATPVELLATLTVVSLHPDRPVAGEIADTALSIAGQAALAIDNARLYAQQKAFADTMQRSLLPRAAPEAPGLELGDVYESAARVEVGGDVYDYLTLGDGRLAVVLGDVTGHGVDATADMAMAKYVFRSLAREHLDPGEFLAAANDVVSSEIAPGRFITMVELVVDATAGEVRCASGGHPPPRLVLPDGTVEPISAGGLALGIDAGQEYETVVADFPPGAIVVAYTDGVIEARNGSELFGVERLDELLASRRTLPPEEIAEAALAAARAWTGGELTDDFAVVVIKRAAAR